MKNTVINRRPMVICALFLMAGIAVSLIITNLIALAWLFVAALSVGSIGLMFLLRKWRIFAFLLCFFVGFLSHFFNHYATVNDFSGEHYIRGKVAQINVANGYYNIILKDLNIDGFDEKGKALLRVYGENPYRMSDRLHFVGDFETREVRLSDSKSMTYYGNGVFYNAKQIAQLTPPVQDTDFYDGLRLRMTGPMSKWLGKNMGIAESLLFGDLSGLSVEDISSIRDTGLSHIFSVSGLHISFVVACIALLLKKLRIRPWLSLAITAAVLFIYCGVTGFPPSAVRSAIMAGIFLLASAMHKKHDALNTLGAAVTVMLVFSPLTLFSLSFIMSVAAVYGILLFYKPLYKWLAGQGGSLRKAVGASVSLSLSANVFLLPISLNVFGSISLYFVLANLLVLPIITVLYTYLFVSGVFCLISPFLGFLYFPANAAIELVRLVSAFISSLPYATLKAGGMGVLTISYVLIMTLFSRFVMLRRYKKIIYAFCCVAASSALYIFW